MQYLLPCLCQEFSLTITLWFKRFLKYVLQPPFVKSVLRLDLDNVVKGKKTLDRLRYKPNPSGKNDFLILRIIVVKDYNHNKSYTVLPYPSQRAAEK